MLTGMWVLATRVKAKTVITRQNHNQRLFDEEFERQVWNPFFTSKKGSIDFSFQEGSRELRRGLTRDHYIDVGQFVPQDQG